MKRNLIISILIVSLCLTGCWNYQEIDDIEIVLGVALDKHGLASDEAYSGVQNQYKITYEVVGIKSNDGQLESQAIQDTGDTVFRAVRKLIEKNGKRAYLSHIKVLIISKELAKEGITEILDYTMRDAEYRPDVHVLISNKGQAGDIYTDKAPNTVVSMGLSDALQNQKKIGTFESTTVWNVIEKISKKGYEPAIPLINLNDQNGEQTHTIAGTAVFKGAQMVGKLSADETFYYLFIDNEIGNQPISMEYFFKNKIGHVSLEILKSETKMTPIEEGDAVIMKIDVKTEVAISELSSIDFDILDDKNREDLEAAAEKKITEGIEDVVFHAQKDYNSDIFGFGDVIKRNKNKVWKKIEGNWDEIYENLPIEVNVDIKIKRSALSSQPIKIDEF